MAGSRLDRIGTIFSRATGLIKAGAVQYQDRPLWYDIYRVFPPKYEPFISREPENKEVVNMLYKEDKFRAMYFKRFGMNPGGIARKLNDRNFEEPSQPFINSCMELMKSRPEWDDDQVFNAAVESHQHKFGSLRSQAPQTSNEPTVDVTDELEAMKRHGRRPPTLTVQSLRSLFEEAQEQQKKRESLLEEADADESGDKTKS